jgi:hypothetical protein
MKRFLAAFLTIALFLSGSTVALAKQADKGNNGKGKGNIAHQQTDPKSKGKKISVNKKDLDKAKEQLTKKVDEKINQLKKLKNYIVSDEGKILIEMVDAATVNTAIKGIDDTIAGLNTMKSNIQAAADNNALNTLAKTLENDWQKNQYFMKRINGITSAAKVYDAYKKTQVLVDKLAKGLSSYTGNNAADLKKRLGAIQTKLESAKINYKEALNLYLSITSNDKVEKTYKTAQDKLKKANKELHDTLKQAQKLLNIVKGIDWDGPVDINKPTVKSAYWSGFGSLEAKVVITFSEQMDASKLVKSAFLKNVNGTSYTALGAEDVLIVASDAKSVTIIIKNPTAINTLGMGVSGVTDLEGNSLEGNAAYSGTNFTLTQDSINVLKVEAISKNTIKVTFDGKLTSVSSTGFSLWEKTAGVNTGITLTMSSPLVTIDNKSEVTFLLGAELSEAAQRNGHTLQLVVSNATYTRNELGTQLSNAPYDENASATRDVADKIAPTITSVIRINENTIVVAFAEKMKASTLSSALSGFNVSGGTSTLTSVTIPGGVDTNTLILTGTGFEAGITKISYNAAAGLTDISGNKLAAFTDRAVTLPQ